jgi:hypothetical protein
MIHPKPPAFDPAIMAESIAAGRQEPFRASTEKRHSRRFCTGGKFSLTRMDGSSF